MIKHHHLLHKYQELYECSLDGKPYGIIGSHRLGSYEALLTLIQKHIPPTVEIARTNISSILNNLRNHTSRLYDEVYVFKILFHYIGNEESPRLAVTSSGVYQTTDIRSTAIGCYITKGDYFGSRKDIKRLKVTNLTNFSLEYV